MLPAKLGTEGKGVEPVAGEVYWTLVPARLPVRPSLGNTVLQIDSMQYCGLDVELSSVKLSGYWRRNAEGTRQEEAYDAELFATMTRGTDSLTLKH